MKNDVNVPSKSNKQLNILKVPDEKSSQCYGSADPDPYQSFTDPEEIADLTLDPEPNGAKNFRILSTFLQAVGSSSTVVQAAIGNEEEDRSGLYIDMGSCVGSVTLVFSDGEELCNTFPLAARSPWLRALLKGTVA